MPCLAKNGCCLETSWILEIEPVLFMFKLGQRALLIISLIICDIVLWINCFSFLLPMKPLFFILMWNNCLCGFISVKVSFLEGWFLMQFGNPHCSSPGIEISISKEQLILPSLGQSYLSPSAFLNQSLLSKFWA